MPSHAFIKIRGARENNLKGCNLNLPLGRFIVVTGLSGSGKSSLAFDTVYAEGQRRYAETFSPYTRQFLERMNKPKVTAIQGIPPAIALGQSNSVRTSRSTVGSMTEIADYLKLLFPLHAELRSPLTGELIQPWTASQIAAALLARHAGCPALITFAVPFPARTPTAAAAQFLQAQGFVRILHRGVPTRLDEWSADGDPARPFTVSVVADRLTLSGEHRARLVEALQSALQYGKGLVTVHPAGAASPLTFSSQWLDPADRHEYTAPTAALFSFNNPIGACPACNGFGRTIDIDYQLALPNRRLTISGGVVKCFSGNTMQNCQRDLLRACRKRHIPTDVPFCQLSQAQQDFVIHGEIGPGKTLDQSYDDGEWYGVQGFFRWLERASYKMTSRIILARYRAYRECAACHGQRFKPETLLWTLHGRNLAQINSTPVRELAPWFGEIDNCLLNIDYLKKDAAAGGQLSNNQYSIFNNQSSTSILLRQIISRLTYLNQVGLGYLTLGRASRTLSGGELQRVNLTTCLGTSLTGTLFVLDEPSIGLHPRDTAQLIGVLRELTRQGNTVLVVEHDAALIRAADHLVELGPGSGADGGQVIFSGSIDNCLLNIDYLKKAAAIGGQTTNNQLSINNYQSSPTLQYLTGARAIPLPARRRPLTAARWLKFTGATKHNISALDFQIPLARFTAVTGVSGSGKSTLVHEIIYKNLARKFKLNASEPGAVKKITGSGPLTGVVIIDQSPLARNARSTPVVYMGAFDHARELFAATDSARQSGLTAGDFSFNGGVGRCLRCAGLGREKIEMQFLSDVFVTCPVCAGRRFQEHVLRARWRGKNIAEVLDLTVSEGLVFFNSGHADAKTQRLCEKITASLRILKSVGLGYLTLGQPTSQLSGGEAQRLKLVGELLVADRGAGSPAGQKLIILDEPTTGLHYEDIRALLGVLQSLADQGHTLLVIEHNMEVVKCADYVLDLGPEAGDRGGKVVAAGTPEEVAAADSRTAPFLAQALRGGGIADRDPVDVAEPAGPAGANNFSPAITVSGAKHHNLKNLSLRIPREKMVVITGLSGSGKSTLAFDLLFAEGQRRYLDCLNSYARQFIEQLEKPRVDAISGIPPAVAIEQRTTRGGHKSTVATVTELYHFMRLLYAKLGVQHDPATGEPCVQQTTAEIAAQIKKVLRRDRAAADGDARLLAPLVRNRKGKYAELAAWAGKKKFPLLRVDGKFVAPADFKPLDRYREHNIDVVIATVSGTEPHLEKLVSRALELGHGTAMLTTAADRRPARRQAAADAIFSAQLFSPATGASFAPLEPNMFSYNSPHGWCPRCQGYGTIADLPADADLSAAEQEQQEELARERLEADRLSVCPECGGARLNPAARAVRFAGRPVTALNALSVNDCLAFFRRRKFTGRAAAIAGDILPEILQRLQFLRHVGLGYLNLDRAAPTLSGGEAQRIRLAAQLGSNLRGVLYILDEPTIGLHPRDNAELIKMLRALQRRGNSLVIVEHDEDTMRAADHIIDLGPGAGVNGGEVIASGTWRQLTRNRQSLTGKLLGRPLRHPLRGQRRPIPPQPRNRRNPAGPTARPPAERSRVKEQHPLWLTVSGASANNLKNLTVNIPLGRLVGVSGVSGSGKSTLMRQAIIPAVSAAIAKRCPPAPLTVSGLGHLVKLIEVDQSPIGKTSRSTVSTYIGLMDWLRKLLALTPLAKTRGFTPTHFSYNAGTGRCPACLGQGLLKIEMNFLPTAYVPCDQCGGKRWTEAVLDVTYRDKNIHDILSLSVDEAVNFFDGQPSLQVPLTLLQETGLGYLTLGQTSPTLSGGEAQRIRLVAELAGIRLQEQRRRLATRAALTGKTLYLLEEPTVGLHLADVQKLLAVLHQLVDAGNTVMVIEHHLDLLAECDYLIDLGPESAAAGGRIIARGTPEQIAANARSYTGRYLRRLLKL